MPWNPFDKAAAITLSNGNYTATSSEGSFQALRSTAGFNSGKRYAEFTLGQPYSPVTEWGGDAGIGFATQAESLTPPDYPWEDTTNSAAYDIQPAFNSGAYFAGVQTVFGQSVDSFAKHSVVSFAIDFTAKKFWYSTTAMRTFFGGTAWNWDVLANQNPATNTGGISFSTMAVGPYYLWFLAWHPYDVTINEGSGVSSSGGIGWDIGAWEVAQAAAPSWNLAIPNGFLAWSANAATAAVTIFPKSASGVLTRLNTVAATTPPVANPFALELTTDFGPGPQPVLILRAKGAATRPTVSASAAVTIFNRTVVATAQFRNPASGTNTIFRVVNGAVQQANPARTIVNPFTNDVSNDFGGGSFDIAFSMRAAAVIGNSNTAHGANNILTRTASGTMTSKTNAQATNAFNIVPASNLKQANPVHTATSDFSAADFSAADFGSGFSLDVVFMKAAGVALRSTPASAALTIAALTPVIVLNAPIAVRGLANIVIGAAGVATPFASKSNIDFTCVAEATPNLEFTAAINLDITPLGLLRQSDRLFATNNVTLTAAAQVRQANPASATNTLTTISADGAFGTSCQGLASFGLAAVAQSDVANLASGTAGPLLPLVVNTPPNLLLTSEDVLTLCAEDGSKLYADILLNNAILEQPATATSALSFDTAVLVNNAATQIAASANLDFSATCTAIQENPAVGIAAPLRLAASGTLGYALAGLASLVFGVGSPPALQLSEENGTRLLAEGGLRLLFDDSTAANLVQQNLATASGALAFASSATALNANITVGQATLAILAAVGQADQTLIAQGNATLGALTATITMGGSRQISGVSDFFILYNQGQVLGNANATAAASLNWTASGALFNYPGPIALATINLTCSGLAYFSQPATATNTIFELSSIGTTFNGNVAAATNTIALSGAATARLETFAQGVANVNIDSLNSSALQIFQATGTANIDLTTVSTATLTVLASASNTLAVIDALVTLDQSRAAQAAATITLEAGGQAAQGLAALGQAALTFSVAAEAAVNGAEFSGLAAMALLRALANVGQADATSALIEVDLLSHGGGVVYKSPVGFVEGDHLIYWSD